MNRTLKRVVKNDSVFHKSQGAIFLQLAFSLPLIIVGMLIFIWVGTFIHSRVVMRDTLQVAIKQGATMGKDGVSYRDIESTTDFASKIRSFRAGSGGTDPVFALLGYRPDVPTTSIESLYNVILSTPSLERDQNPSDPMLGIIDGIRRVPSEYLYAMVLAYEGVRESLGKAVIRYPCTWTELKTKPGCLTCVPIVRRSSLANGSHAINVRAQCLSRNSISLQCSYHASFSILNSIGQLIRLITKGGGGTLTPIIDETVEGYSSRSGLLSNDPTEQIEHQQCVTGGF